MVGSFTVRDVSSTGERLLGLVEAARRAFTGARRVPRVQVRPGAAKHLRVELSNICGKTGCFLGATATLSFSDADGLEQRFTVHRAAPLEGTDIQPTLDRLRPLLLAPLEHWLLALSADPALLATWLRDGPDEKREAALQAMVDRGLSELSGALLPIMTGGARALRLRAVAVAGALGGDEVVEGLERAAGGTDPEVARAALQALRDHKSAAAQSALRRLARGAALEEIRLKLAP